MNLEWDFSTNKSRKGNPGYDPAQNPEMNKIQNVEIPELDKIPNWTKSRIGQNPQWTKSRLGQNPELEKTPELNQLQK